MGGLLYAFCVAIPIVAERLRFHKVTGLHYGVAPDSIFVIRLLVSGARLAVMAVDHSRSFARPALSQVDSGGVTLNNGQSKSPFVN
jgi:hypothetical protein